MLDSRGVAETGKAFGFVVEGVSDGSVVFDLEGVLVVLDGEEDRERSE